MKKILCLIMALVMVFSLCACGAKEEAPAAPAAPAEKAEAAPAAPAAPAEEPVEINIGHIYATNHAIGQACEVFKEKVEELSGGSVSVVIYPHPSASRNALPDGQ